MIKRFVAFDFDNTLMSTPLPMEGKMEWERFYGRVYPYIGWWSKPESLDLKAFDIKPIPTVYNQFVFEKSKPNTYVIVLTSRMDRLRTYVEAVLDYNEIVVDKLDMKKDNYSKGEKILKYIQTFPELEEVSVYDDRDIEIESYESVRNQIPENIQFNVYFVDNGKISLVENALQKIVKEEINEFIQKK